MQLIKLTQGKFAMVDDSDFEYLNQWKWHFNSRYVVRAQHNNCHSKCKGKGCKKIFIHREIMKPQENMQIDHINGNTLDNQKQNLRIVTFHQNRMNRKLQSNNTSGFKGVSLIKKTGKWRAQIKVIPKTIYLGNFDSKELAAKAYDKASKIYHGKYGRINL